MFVLSKLLGISILSVVRMKEISIIGSGLSTMCRLCLSSGVTLLDMFSYSSKMGNRVAGVIMKCAAVQITRGDGMPNFICESCYTQLEKTHQFQMQIENSDKTLRHYFQQLFASDKPIKTECSVQPSENYFILNTGKDIAKCESLDEFDIEENLIQENKIKDEMSLKSEIKEEKVDDNLLNITESVDDTNLGWKDSEPANLIQENKYNENMSLKPEIKVENMDDNLLNLTKSLDDTVNALSIADENEVSCEDTKINISHASEISCLRSANVSENFSKCDETYKNINIYRKKHKNSNKLKSYQCDICSKCFSGQSGLYYHKRAHTGEKPYQCDLCNKCFSNSSNLNQHKRIHTGEKPYQCDICNKFFSQSRHLNDHKRIHTGEKPYQCNLCKKCFSVSSHLYQHKRIHTGEKPYQCDLCNKCFSQSSNFNKHKLIHTGEKPYQCDICNKSFSQSSHLNDHKRIHTREKPYQCGLCNKCFSQSSNFNKHKLIHTGEKPYQCDICNKCFSKSYDFIRHKRVHTGEKPYECDLCHKCFSILGNLNKHKRVHCGEKRY